MLVRFTLPPLLPLLLLVLEFETVRTSEVVPLSSVPLLLLLPSLPLPPAALLLSSLLANSSPAVQCSKCSVLCWHAE
jgi:hypothetical protein